MLPDCAVRMIFHDLNTEAVLQSQVIRFSKPKDQIDRGKVSEDHLCDQCRALDFDRQHLLDLFIRSPASHIGNARLILQFPRMPPSNGFTRME